MTLLLTAALIVYGIGWLIAVPFAAKWLYGKPVVEERGDAAMCGFMALWTALCWPVLVVVGAAYLLGYAVAKITGLVK